MKRIMSFVVTAMFAILICFSVTSCSDDMIKQLQNDYGAILEGDFEKGVDLITELVAENGADWNDVIAMLENQEYDKDGKVSILDIYVSKDGKEIQPSGKVKITIPVPFESENGYEVFHVKDDNSVENLESTYADGKITFETESFSYFVVAEEKKNDEPHQLKIEQIGAGGYVEIVGTEFSVGENTPYVENYLPNESITMHAYVRSDEYKFLGWFEPTDEVVTHIVLKDTPVSTNVEYTYTMGDNDYTLYAVFDAKVVGLSLDGANAGFVEGVATYTIGDEIKPVPENVVVSGIAANNLIPFTKDIDYTIDLGGLDFSKEGSYTITYTYKKDITIKETLTVNVVGQTCDFQALVYGGNCKIYYNSEEMPNGYYNQIKTGSTITLNAVADQGYQFVGWFEPTSDALTHIELKETPVSTDREHTFTMGNTDYTVYAVFEALVTALILDAHNAGFTYENDELAEKTVVTIGDEYTPKADYVLVYGVTADGNIVLTKDTDYTVDLGGLDFETEGTYTITYTYKKDITNKATLTVEVVSQLYNFQALVYGGNGIIYHNLEEMPNGYFNQIKEGATVTLNAVANQDYQFVGWYEPTAEAVTHIELKDTPVSTDREYTFTMGNTDYTVYAVFEALVTALILDAHNAGFTYENDELAEKTVVTIGDEYTPKADYVLVYGVTADGNIVLTKDTDYTVDLGGLDFETEGTYTITYTYIKDPTIKATLTVEVTMPTYVFQATVETGHGKIYYNSVEQSEDGYYAELKENETVKLQAVADEDCVFVGWYTATDIPELISTEAEHTFTMSNSEQYVFARFEALVTSLSLDAHNAGFTYENDELAEKTVVTIGDEYTPNADYVLVYGVTVDGNIALTKDTDYTVDIGGLDFETEGTYTITYTYKKDTTIKATLTVEVVAQEDIGINLTYEGSASPVEYNGGRAAYVFKSSIKNNGEACDIEALGLSYEWRNHSTGEVVDVDRDDTWDEELHYSSPAKVGVYDFVVYEVVDGQKKDLLTETREIIENQFSVVSDSLTISEYTIYTVISKVGDKYYAMSNPFEGNTEREAIEVTPDENGIISLGTNYEFVFRFYDSGKKDSNDNTLYRVRIGNGTYRTGNIILWSSGGIEYSTSTSADYTLSVSLNEDGTAYIHNPYCGGTLRLVYDETAGKYMFTAKSVDDDQRESYSVYLYSKYTEPVEETKEVYEFNSKLTKDYDGNAVSFNIYKDVTICTESGEDISVILKNETGRFVWTDIKGNIILVGTPDEEGNVTGPSDIGMYQLVFQTLEKGETGMEWTEKAILHTFEICESSTSN
ncbi:MAG: bacterial Ig-like domain-containing protein [Anaeroplasmataceae bacterium]